MSRVRKAARAAGAVAWLLITTPVNAAGRFDGTTPMLCAVTSVSECEVSGQCERATGGSANVPPFIRVDVGQRMLTAPDASGRKTEIKASSVVDGQLVLHGGEAGRGWTMVIAIDTGRLGAAIVEHDGSFAIFGACVLP